MRVLGRIRLSRLTEESTSAARQRDIIEAWAKSNEHEIVGWAEDLDVSGSVDPFHTPALGPWFKREDEWDILCAWKLDRVGRRAIPLNHVFGWMMEREKTLVCVADNIDLSTWVGRLVANVIAGVAEGELESIRERSRGSRKKLLETGRWPGGQIPFGLTPVPLAGGGWKLAVEPTQAAVIRQMVYTLYTGASVDSVAKAAGINVSSTWKMLRAKYLIGHATYGGDTVRDPDGAPVLYAEPILTADEWDRLQTALEKRGQNQARTRSHAPMSGVVTCLLCGKNMHHKTYKSARYRYYHCPDHVVMVDAEEVEAVLEDLFLREWGDKLVTERVYRPANDNQIAIAEAVRAVDELTALLGHSLSRTVTAKLTAQLRALDERIAELENLPSREAGWEEVNTGLTYRELWETGDQRQLMLDAGITLAVHREKRTKFVRSVLTQKIPPAKGEGESASQC